MISSLFSTSPSREGLLLDPKLGGLPGPAYTHYHASLSLGRWGSGPGPHTYAASTSPLRHSSHVCVCIYNGFCLAVSLGLSTTWSQHSRSQHGRSTCSRHEDRKPSEVLWNACLPWSCVHANLLPSCLPHDGQVRASYLTSAPLYTPEDGEKQMCVSLESLEE